MDERLKKITELSKKVTKKGKSNEEIINTITKKFPKLKKYTYKTNKMTIKKGHMIVCISLDLKNEFEGIITSVKYFDNKNSKENEQKIIKTIYATNNKTNKRKQINVLHYYLFTKQFYGELNDTREGKLILDEIKKYYNSDIKIEESSGYDITSQDKLNIEFFEEELKKYKN